MPEDMSKLNYWGHALRTRIDDFRFRRLLSKIESNFGLLRNLSGVKADS
jgi:hypothetical protein